MPRILVVEDEEGVRAYLRSLLEANGYDVLVASGGREALGVLDSVNGMVDLLLTDVDMPEMTGLDLGREVERLLPGMRVIFMSGSAERLTSDTKGRLMIAKPFQGHVLLSILRSVLSDPSR